jgi:tetratricopeptide (TPR) repeat protein
VLDSLSKVATDLRGKLGESLATVKKFDTPLAEASTSSLEALQAYSKGSALTSAGEFAAAIPLLKRAIELDPNFAMAYAGLSTSYVDIGETGQAVRNIEKAYELRDRVSERERFYIESHYEESGTGDLTKARELFEQWLKAYPRDSVTYTNLGVVDFQLGDYQKGFENGMAAFKLNPSGLNYTNLISNYQTLNRFDEALALAADAQSKGLDSSYLHIGLYQLAFVRNDSKAMAAEVDWSRGKASVEDVFIGQEADTAGYYGQFRKAQAFTKQAADLAERADEKEVAAEYWTQAALRSALLGYPDEAKKSVAAASALASAPDINYLMALALAFAGDTAKAEAMTDALAKHAGSNTSINAIYLPVLRAQIALNRRDPQKAIDQLVAAEQFELGQMQLSAITPGVYAPYVRGEAYLALKQGPQAAAEFQKIIDLPGIVVNNPNGIMAYLGLARAYAVQGDDAKARVAYQNLFAKWKDADPDLPVLLQAKAEYAKLK